MIGPQPPKPGEEISPEEAIKRNIEARAKKMEDKLLGTIHILRNHIFRIFGPPSPPYVIMFLVLKIIKNWHFLTPLPPLLVIT